jgi:hypothetical protein
MRFRFTGISAEPFRHLFALSDEELAARDMRRFVAGPEGGFPCRVSLKDAAPGERLILLSYEHQPVDSPYRASGPIFVGEGAGAPYDGPEVPPVVRTRLMSLRAYDRDGMIVDAAVEQGEQIEPVLERLFARDDVAYIHVHNAGRGCYSCRVDRG